MSECQSNKPLQGCNAVLSEVSRGHSRYETSSEKKKAEKPHRATEGLNVKLRQNIKEIIEAKKKKKEESAEPRKRTAYLMIGQKPKANSKRSIATIKREDGQASCEKQLQVNVRKDT